MASSHAQEEEGIANEKATNEPLLSYAERYSTSSLDSEDDAIDDEALLDSDLPEVRDGAEAEAADPFLSFDDLPDEDRNILTFRAILVGLLCGGLVNASNIYLGLKSGWTSGANIFGSIVGFAVLRSCSKYCSAIPLLGGEFGPRENNIVQTVATAAGGLSNVFVSAIPAMYQLDLLQTPLQDFWRITILTAIGAYFGLFFATPLRSFFVIHAARELQLIFPSSYATATTIRSIHLAVDGADMAKQKMRALSYGFGYAMICRVLSQFAVGILWDWHPFTWLYLITGSKAALTLESWGWFVEWTPAFIGSGMLVGLNVALSFVGGSVLAWGIIGPILVNNGIAFGQPAVPNDQTWDGLMSYSSLSDEFASANHPSPRYWLLWPGITCMIAVSFTGRNVDVAAWINSGAGNGMCCHEKPVWYADITPLTAASKASQIILGATTSGQGWTLQQAQRLNLIGGALASIGANQAADLTGDFRVGFLLRTSPKLQWFAQSIGTFVAVFLAPSIFVLFATAYPCILDASPDTCPFAAPSVSAWRAVAIAVTSSDFVIPSSSKWFSILFAVFGVFMVLLRHCVWTGRWEWVRTYHPNMMIISLAFLLPSTVYGTAMFIGAGLAWAWNKKSPQSYAIFGSAVAAGFMAGEGIGGVINAAMTVMGVDFDKIGTSFLCPGDKC
ncbi:hypothetical protein V496_01434 [Pseudogymnoascus sp. VKM F-4515 (FW-2607)]|nr:hypothetical protein V496_01434 [Pseudogymnoascus sp. VKM F-4515 (FW-2607)]